MIKITVIITSYNQEDTLPEAIESVIQQTLPTHEIIVCDDASSDRSQELIRTYVANYGDRVRGIYHKNNLGVAANRNSGLRLVSGELVTWLDGDDIFLPQKLELEASLLSQNATVKWVYSQVIEYNASLQIRRLRYHAPLNGMIFEGVISTLGKAPRNPLVVYTDLEKVGFFNESLSMYEDFDLCLRLAKLYPCLYQAQPAMEYRHNPDGLSSKGFRHHWSNIQILQQHLLRYTRDSSEPERKRLLKRFLSNEKVVCLNLINNFDVNRKIELIRYLLRVICHNPVLLKKPLLYRSLSTHLLPAGLRSRLKQVKDAVFG